VTRETFAVFSYERIEENVLGRVVSINFLSVMLLQCILHVLKQSTRWFYFLYVHHGLTGLKKVWICYYKMFNLHQLVFWNITLLSTRYLRYYYALASIKPQYKNITAKHGKLNVSGYNNAQEKKQFNAQTAITLFSWATTNTPQVHNCTNHDSHKQTQSNAVKTINHKRVL